jgi:hypothetical protein
MCEGVAPKGTCFWLKDIKDIAQLLRELQYLRSHFQLMVALGCWCLLRRYYTIEILSCGRGLY